MSESDGSGHAPNIFLAARIARMHYIDGLTNLDIAGQLGISRFRVARLIERAVKAGIVKITINSPIEIDQDASTALIARYGLSEALVYPVSDRNSEANNAPLISDNVGFLAARYLADVLTDGATFGVTWGKAIESVTRALPQLGGFPRADVVQLVGGLSAAADSMQAMDVLTRFSNATAGELHALHAPLVVENLQTAIGLRSESSIQRTLSQVSNLDAAIVGIGSWEPPSSQMIGLFTEKDIAEARARNAAADICAIVVDEEGKELRGAFADHTIRADSQDFRSIPCRIGVASGSSKTQAIKAALRGKWINVLVTDSVVAGQLLGVGSSEPAPSSR